MAGVCDIPGPTSSSFVWQSWFPRYASYVGRASSECYALFQEQPTNFSAWGDTMPQNPDCPDVHDLITCMWNRIPPWLQLEFSSAQVVLGMAPAIISLMAPSISEVAMLSSTRPILAFLLSLGSPTLYSFRSLSFNDPLDALRLQQQYLSSESRLQQHRTSGWNRRLVATSIIQYVLALASMGNVMWTSWQLGSQTLLAYRAGLLLLPFLWSTLGALVHLVAAISWHTSNTARAVRTQAGRSSSPLSFAQKTKQLLMREITPCVAAPQRYFLANRRSESALTLALNVIAGFMGIVLLVFATATFSSLLFIGPLDALAVAIRYMLSTIVTRFVIAYELDGLAAAEGMTAPEESYSPKWGLTEPPPRPSKPVAVY